MHSMRAELVCIQSLMFGAQNDTGHYKTQNGILLPADVLFGKYNDCKRIGAGSSSAAYRVTEGAQSCLLPMPVQVKMSKAGLCTSALRWLRTWFTWPGIVAGTLNSSRSTWIARPRFWSRFDSIQNAIVDRVSVRENRRSLSGKPVHKSTLNCRGQRSKASEFRLSASMLACRRRRSVLSSYQGPGWYRLRRMAQNAAIAGSTQPSPATRLLRESSLCPHAIERRKVHLSS
jgi:hypothetical protein